MTGTYLIAGAFVALSLLTYLVLWAVMRRRRHARSAGVQQMAAAKHWSYAVQDDAWYSRWKGHPFSQVAGKQRALDVVTGRLGVSRFAVFTYAYDATVMRHGKPARDSYCYGIIAVELPQALPAFALLQKWAIVHQRAVEGELPIGGTLCSDLKLESEAFNRMFVVHSENPKLASDILHPRAMESLMSQSRPLNWRIDGNTLLGWSLTPLSPEQIAAHLTVAEAFIGLIPKFVWTDHGRPVEIGRNPF